MGGLGRRTSNREYPEGVDESLVREILVEVKTGSCTLSSPISQRGVMRCKDLPEVWIGVVAEPWQCHTHPTVSAIDFRVRVVSRIPDCNFQILLVYRP